MSLTLAEARARAAQISHVSYVVSLDLTGCTESFGSTTVIGFSSSGPETFLELSDATDLQVTVDGVRVEAAYADGRVALSGLGGDHQVVVAARLPYVTDGDGMHTFTDPADGERYVSAYLGMDVTQRVFACFDQTDLKATIELAVVADPAWTVLANGRATHREGGSWRYATTPVIPCDLFVVCAGPWHSVTWEHAGLPFGWHARRSLAAELERDAAELRSTTDACFDHYAEIFAEPYPFDGYDQIFVPGQNWGAQEMPGCVTYRDELLPRDRITDHQRTQRATVIAHEMAHMWFGDLVTMTWWEDTWLQESFADYMGYRVAHDGAGFADTLVSHELGRKPAAYDADVRRSTHPVAPRAEEVADVDAAFGNFDAISYAKGNSCVRQLVTWLGDEDFLAGVNTYFERHRFANATLEDFVAALDASSPLDVAAWVEVWLRQSGFDTLRVTRDGEVPVLSREGGRPHRVPVTSYDDSLTQLETRLVDLADEPVRLEDWAGRVVLPNAQGETFAPIEPDDVSWAALTRGLSTLDDALARAIVWNCAFDRVKHRRTSAGDYLDLVARQLPAEPHVAIISAVLLRTRTTVLTHDVPADGAAAALAAVAQTCRAGLAGLDGLDGRPDEQRAIAFSQGLAGTSTDDGLLRRWLDADRTDEGLALDPGLRWAVVHRLAEIGAADADLIEAERQRDGGFGGTLGAARALAARPTPQAKAEAWAAAAEDDRVSNRVFEATLAGLWSAEQAELVAPYVSRYVAEGAEIARRRGQAFSQVVGRAFPQVSLSDEQVGELETALAGEVPSVLRRHWEDRLDDLRLARG